MPADWDKEGSEAYLPETWETAIKVAKTVATHLACPPRISPCFAGSIDLDWETPDFGLLINIKKAGKEATFFADNKRTGWEIEGDFQVSNIDTFLRSLMIP